VDGQPSAVIVGGGSGIGAALVGRYRSAGTPVTVWDVAGEVDVTCDITDPEQVDEAVARTLAEGRPPTEVTITAGIGHGSFLLDLDADDFDRVLAVNARGPWLVMRSFVRALRPSTEGVSFVATSSVSGHIADRTMGAYCASKAALDMLVRVAAAEWAPLGIRVNAVAPGVTDTPLLGDTPRDEGWLGRVARRTALGRLGSADDIVDAILAVHGLTWITGQIIDCDGGLGLHSPVDPLGRARLVDAAGPAAEAGPQSGDGV
jgi:NAD(P)-dependent dehydrogenase (short-subunit alcohol dehydrogenase family)